MMRLSPRYGAAAAGQWVGFSDLCGLTEEAVLRWFGEQGHPPGALAHDLGARLTVADASVLITGRLRLDEECAAQVRPLGSRYYDVRVAAVRADGAKDVIRGRLTMALITSRPAESLSADLAPLAVREISGMGTAVGSHDTRFEEKALAEAAAAGGPEGLHSSWRVPYSACRYDGYMRHSAFVTALEGLTECFFAEHQVPVGLMAARHGLLPVFTRARLRLVGEARVDETLHGVYSPAQVVQDKMIDGRADFYVYREGVAMPVATAIFLHGLGPADGQAVTRGSWLPDALLAAVPQPEASVAGAEGR